MKGKEQPVGVCVLEKERRAGVQVRGGARAGSRQGRMFGRRLELEVVKQRWEESRAGHGRTVLVEGEAGVGKTRLLEAALSALPDTALVTRAACFEHLQAAPFTPWMEALQSVLEIPQGDLPDRRTQAVQAYLRERVADLVEFGSLLNPLLNLSLPQSQVMGSLDAQSRRQKLFELITRILAEAADGHGHVILLEDLHWVDESSLALVAHLARHDAETPVLLLVTSRPTETPSDLEGAEVTRVVLAELSQAESLAMVREALGVTDLPVEVGEAVYAKTKGNPLFLEEVIRSLQAPGVLERILSASSVTRAAELAALEIPDRVQGLLMSRIDRLPPDTREVLKAGSVAGRSFDQNLLGGIDDPLLRPASLERAFDELIAAALVVADEEGALSHVTFRHALVQDVAYESIPFARRRDLHGRVAHYLESVLASPDHGLLVHHYEHAGDAKMTRLHAVKASEASVAVYANREAIDYLDVALSTASAPTTHDACLRSRLDELVGDSLALLGRHEEALHCFSDARRRWRSPRVRRVSHEVLRDLSPIDDVEARESLLCWKIAAAAERGLAAYKRGLRWLEKAEDALPPDKTALTARVLIARSALLYRLGHFREAADVGESALALARQSGDDALHAFALTTLTLSLENMGLLARSIECNKEAIGLYEQSGDLSGLWVCHANLASAYLKLGDVRGSLEHDETSLNLAARIGDVNGLATQHLNVGTDLIQLGEADAAAKHLEEAVAFRTHKGVGPGLIGFSLVLLAQARLRCGDLAGAGQALVEGRTILERLEAQGLLLDVWVIEAELALAKGALDEAEQSCAKTLSQAQTLGVALSEAQALCMRGRVRVAQGDPEGAIPGLESCITLAENSGFAYEHAQALAVLAEARAACGDEEESCEDLLYEAIRMFRKMGARYDLERAVAVRARLESLNPSGG